MFVYILTRLHKTGETVQTTQTQTIANEYSKFVAKHTEQYVQGDHREPDIFK